MHKNGNITTYRQELRQRILETSIVMFKQRGIRAVKMDDVASALSISKRTLYEIYDNKERLLFECVKQDTEARARYITDFAAKANNEMEILIEAMKQNLADLSGISSLYFLELHKYKDVIDYLHSRHKEREQYSIEFMKKCEEHGYFLPGHNFELTVKYVDMVMSYVMTNRLYEQYTMQDLVSNFIYVLIRGMCTDKGLKVLNEYHLF